MVTREGTAMTGGTGKVASGIRQPTQQQSMQMLPLEWRLSGSSWPLGEWWQMAPSGSNVPSAAARAAPKLVSKPDSATT